MRKTAAVSKTASILTRVFRKRAFELDPVTGREVYSDDELIEDALGDAKQVDRGRESFDQYIDKYVNMAAESRRHKFKRRLSQRLAAALNATGYSHRVPEALRNEL